jgi:hypothetical protein
VVHAACLLHVCCCVFGFDCVCVIRVLWPRFTMWLIKCCTAPLATRKLRARQYTQVVNNSHQTSKHVTVLLVELTWLACACDAVMPATQQRASKAKLRSAKLALPLRVVYCSRHTTTCHSKLRELARVRFNTALHTYIHTHEELCTHN